MDHIAVLQLLVTLFIFIVFFKEIMKFLMPFMPFVLVGTSFAFIFGGVGPEAPVVAYVTTLIGSMLDPYQ